MKALITAVLILCYSFAYSQQTYYEITAGNGYGIRFWQSDTYKIHMGNTPEYLYGPVTDYSIKMNMDGTPGRGWTWGSAGAAPIAALSNIGNLQIAGTLRAGGNIGVGTVPYSSSRLHVKAAVDTPWNMISESSSNGRIIGLSHDGTKGIVAVSYLGNSGFSPLQFWTSNLARLTIDVGGNVGIGTTLPNEKLTVSGTIYGKEVKVDLSVPGPDYVFSKDYSLPSLQELQDFIDLHQHLPEIPSAKEMESNGIELGVMNMLLLKKIEELTLYVIQLKKENQKQDEVIQHLQKK